MKEIFGKTKVKEKSFPKNLTIGDTKITEKLLIAKYMLIQARNLCPFFQTVQKRFKPFDQRLIRF